MDLQGFARDLPWFFLIPWIAAAILAAKGLGEVFVEDSAIRGIISFVSAGVLFLLPFGVLAVLAQIARFLV